ncbi:hypothetical protein U6B65_05795 [Oscillospiraceae bacterium MB08-C2-2]|nr:hypothetical protein U6B65_05795 [Oscillospiraceae bacterium MB08-C2-2]
MQKGFVKISNSIFEYGLTSSEMLVYCYLSSKCWLLPYVTIKQSTIAAAVGLSRKKNSPPKNFIIIRGRKRDAAGRRSTVSRAPCDFGYAFGTFSACIE